MDNKSLKKLEADLWESADLLRAGSKLTFNQYCMPVLGLLFLRGPDQAAPPLGQHIVGVPAHHAGIRNELDQRIAPGLVIVLRDVQLVLQRRAGFGVLIGQQLKLRRDLGDHRLEFRVRGLVRLSAAHATAAVGAARPMLFLFVKMIIFNLTTIVLQQIFHTAS